MPASAAIDVVGRLASRSLVIVDDEATGVRYRLLDSIRAFALDAMADGGLTERALAAHAAWFADAAASIDRRRAQRPPGRAPRVRPGRARQHRRRPGLERDARPAARAQHRQRVRLGLDRPRRQPRRAADPARRSTPPATAAPSRRPRRRAAARGVDRGVDGPPRARPRAHRRGHATGGRDRRRRPAGALLLLPRLRRVASRRVRAGAGADRSQPARSTTGWTGRGIRPRTGSSPPGPRSRPATARAPPRRATRSSTGCATVDDPWLHVRRDAMLGELARIEHRFDDAVVHIGRAAETSGRLGFLQTEAYQLSSLGRAQCQAGDYAAGAATLELAIEKAEATGDVRLAALARVHLGRVLRALGQRRTGAGGARSGDRVAPRRRRRRAGRARRVPAGGARRRGRSPRRGAAARRDPRRGAARRRRPRRGLRPRRARPHRRRRGDIAAARDLLRGGRPAHGGRLALHHRARPDRRPRGQADRLRRQGRRHTAAPEPWLADDRSPAARPSGARDRRAGSARRRPAARRRRWRCRRSAGR